MRVCKPFGKAAADALGVKGGVVVHGARQRHLLRVGARLGAVDVLLGDVLVHLKARERRIAVVIGGCLGGRHIGGTVGEFQMERLCAVRVVGDEEEAAHPAVVDVLRVVVDVHGVRRRRVERGDLRAVAAVHHRGGSARAADLARLDPEGDDHVFVGIQREVARLCRVGRAGDGHQHDGKHIVGVRLIEGEAVVPSVDDVFKIAVVVAF